MNDFARIAAVLGSAFFSALPSVAAEYSPHAFVEYPTAVFWGDTHVHSSLSMDANAIGNTRLTPAAAYRFARGEKVVATSGMTAQLGQPLDLSLYRVIAAI